MVGWGDDSFGEIDVPPGLSNVVAIAAGYEFSLALKTDGTVVAWGDFGGSPVVVPEGLTNVVAISAYADDLYGLALLRNGTVVAWDVEGGPNQMTVPASVTNAVAIAAGNGFSLALLANGTVAAWSYYSFVSGMLTNVPTGLSNVVAIAAGGETAMAVFRVGSVVTGSNLVLGSPGFLANRQFQFTVTGGGMGQGYSVLASTNLVNWITLTNRSITNSPFLFRDLSATNYPKRFYRLETP